MARFTESLLGIEGGGTRTTAAFWDASSQTETLLELAPANLRLASDGELLRLFRGIRARTARPSGVGVGLAGARGAEDLDRLNGLVISVWPGIPSRVGSDLTTGWMAAGMARVDRVLTISGTGSCSYGWDGADREVKVGGWGHLLGDWGSGYELGLKALRTTLAILDRSGEWNGFGVSVLRQLQMTAPDQLISWAHSASKAEIAALAPLVFAHQDADPTLADVISSCRDALADQSLACARRLAGTKLRSAEVVLAGSLLRRQPAFAEAIARQLRPEVGSVRVLERDSVWGALEMAHQAWARAQTHPSPAARPQRKQTRAKDLGPIPTSRELPPTERRNPRSANLDRLDLPEAIRLMLREEARVPKAIEAQTPLLVRLIRMAERALRRGGRLIYAGAGTSGRLGVLDASECPPTFRTAPELVQGIMAGGPRALHSAVEGAEDDVEAGAAAIRFRKVTAKDLVVGIAASGRTPFVWGALGEARQRRARTALICFNPHLKFARGHRPDVVLAVETGPEVLTGSTRLKAGTATKLILNCLTTLTMVRMGKVVGNLMVDLNPSNTKLRDRAVRIVGELTGATATEAMDALEREGWVVKRALARIRGARGRS
jgi:N-acetylmuramic acid 6-phosphate etherase